YNAIERIDDIVFSLSITDQHGYWLVGTNTDVLGTDVPFVEGPGRVVFDIASVGLLDGVYDVSVGAHNKLRGVIYAQRHQPDHSADRLLAGRYALGSTLGAGGMGEVRTATDVRLGREVAVKLLRLDGADIDARRRFETEARAAARIAHPNAVAIYDFGEDTD